VLSRLQRHYDFLTGADGTRLNAIDDDLVLPRPIPALLSTDADDSDAR
jgi:hypothetical protein